MDTKYLSPALGVEITGVDPSRLSEKEAGLVYEAWLKHHLVLIRGFELTEESLIHLGRVFGAVEKARFASPLASHPEIMVISNIREGGRALGSLPDGELYWHYDRIHQAVPNKAGLLYALRLPARGGETRFANMCEIYARLPEDLKLRLAGLTALNTYQYGQTRSESKVLSNETPSAVHPVVRTIPETGKQALYVCRLMTDRIMELEEPEGSELLNLLFDHAENSEFVYEHTWRRHDLLIWDNRCVTHARNDFNENEPRLLKRVTIADDRSPAS